MIAKVRIAPIEQWCEHRKDGVEPGVLAKAPGIEVLIDTATMSLNPLCGGKQWKHVPDDVNRTRELSGLEPTEQTDRILCEHMLEMD